jgi:small-conductance mechanosensitive channel
MKDGLFSSYPNFEFCSSVCASAKREASEEQRTRESAERSDAEYQSKAYEAQQKIYEAQQRANEAQQLAQTAKLDELIRLQRESNIIAEDESEARSLGISRRELLARREKKRRDDEIADTKKKAKLLGLTVNQYKEKCTQDHIEKIAEEKARDAKAYADYIAKQKEGIGKDGFLMIIGFIVWIFFNIIAFSQSFFWGVIILFSPAIILLLCWLLALILPE